MIIWEHCYIIDYLLKPRATGYSKVNVIYLFNPRVLRDGEA